MRYCSSVVASAWVGATWIMCMCESRVCFYAPASGNLIYKKKGLWQKSHKNTALTTRTTTPPPCKVRPPPPQQSKNIAIYKNRHHCKSTTTTTRLDYIELLQNATRISPQKLRHRSISKALPTRQLQNTTTTTITSPPAGRNQYLSNRFIQAER